MKSSSYRLPAVLMAGAVALAACSEDADAEVTAEDIENIEQTLVNGSKLHWELTQTESRVAQHCMEDQDFTVHDPHRLFGNGIPHRFDGFSSPYDDLPTVEQAEKFGFGMWLFHAGPEANAELEGDPDYIEFRGDEDGFWDPNWNQRQEEWKEMSEEYRQEWNEAFLGPEAAEVQRELDAMSHEEFMESMDDEVRERPPFGGCELTTIETVYGGPEHHEAEWGEYWAKPDLESPLTLIGDGELFTRLSADFWEQENGFLDCVGERGYGAWEFDEFRMLPIWDYFSQIDPVMPRGEPVPENLPEAPSDVSSDPDELKAYEFAMAADFAECAEAAGLDEEVEDAWARMNVEQLMVHETEVYAWEQEIDEYLTNAQEYLAS